MNAHKCRVNSHSGPDILTPSDEFCSLGHNASSPTDKIVGPEGM
jgi:hypothetical protein